MIKEYRISLKVACDVREKVRGNGGKFNMKFTQEIMNSLLSNPELLNDYYLCRLIENYHPCEALPFIAEKYDELESYNQFWLNLKKILTPEVREYFEENVFGDNSYRDEQGNFLTDVNRDLITEQLDNFSIICFSFEELKTGEVNTVDEPVVLLNINHTGT
jgi:hypothetical protein